MPCVAREKCVSPAVWRTRHRPVASRHRARRRRPRLAGLVVAHEERLAGRIADRIVGERRQPVLAAVARPGVRRARGGDDRAEPRVGDDVGPGHRRFLVAVEDDRVRPSVVGEPAEPVRQRHRRQGEGVAIGMPPGGRGPGDVGTKAPAAAGPAGPIELRPKVARCRRARIARATASSRTRSAWPIRSARSR